MATTLLTQQLVSAFDPVTGEIHGASNAKRHLSDLRGCFADETAYAATLAVGNPLLYTVASIEPAAGEGDLHCGVGLVRPGKIGDEYFMTKGHLHEWRSAAEFYLGLTGNGLMLLEDEDTGSSRVIPLLPNQVVYVPGHTLHRTVNVGSTPLTYLGIYPARAGHDYHTIARTNFRCVVVECKGLPTMLERKDFLK
ncbi:MAG: glucose-6-phosphate isomerase family protein [Verrucomicrobiota bacterium]|jgi:glucose-6-phosphate isomerase